MDSLHLHHISNQILLLDNYTFPSRPMLREHPCHNWEAYKTSLRAQTSPNAAKYTEYDVDFS